MSGVLVLNSGSSSIKFHLYNSENLTSLLSGSANGLTISGDVEPTLEIKENNVKSKEALPEGTHNAALSAIASKIQAASIDKIAAVGHRIVHGGPYFTKSCQLTSKTLHKLDGVSALAPLHNPHNLSGVMAAASSFPEAVQVGVFDTAYHSTMPAHASTYPLPSDLRAKYRRYGFHGTSHKFVVEAASRFLGKASINAVSFHLGNGCSVSCIKDGLSVDTSMGYTPLAGLPMGTRCGDIDPSIVLQMLRDGVQVEEIEEILQKRSGLYGLAGTSDSLAVEQGRERGDKDCTLALETFCYSAKKYLGAYSAVLGSVDCVIFTGGVGENSAEVRQLICQGVVPISNERNYGFNRKLAVCDVTESDSAGPRVIVVKTDEELAIARDCLTFIT